MVLPQPGGPAIQIPGRSRMRSNRSNSRFLGKTPVRIGGVTLLTIHSRFTQYPSTFFGARLKEVVISFLFKDLIMIGNQGQFLLREGFFEYGEVKKPGTIVLAFIVNNLVTAFVLWISISAIQTFQYAGYNIDSFLA